MGLAEQIAAVLAAPFALLRLRSAGRRWLALYSLAAAALLCALAWLLIANQDALRSLLLSYLLPNSWHLAGDTLIRYFLANQTQAVLVNATMSGTLVLISVLLFPLKERASTAFERESGLVSEAPQEFPLWFQALEELKLVLVYAVAQCSILWIGYHPHPARKGLATALSFAFLFFAFAVDFISPLLQRHRLRYAQILKGLLLRPLLLFGFGAIVAWPALVANLYLAKAKGLSFTTAVLFGFGANLVAIIVAIVAGTWVGAKLLGPLRDEAPPHRVTRLLAWVLLLALASLNGYVFGNIGRSIHHKSQLLKCDYSLVSGSFKLSWPKWTTLLTGELRLGIAFDVEVRNPTPFDLVVERSRLELRHEEALVATSELEALAVPAHQTRRQRLALQLAIDAAVLRKGRALLKDRWNLTLFIRVTETIEFPIYLRDAMAKELATAGKK